MKSEKKALWSGRFSAAANEAMIKIGESISYDRKLYYEDLVGSAAHVRMLGHQGILSSEDVQAITSGLQKVRAEIELGDFQYDLALEDIHMHIEKRLTELVGEAGKKMHTARSRNDQIATDVHLYLKKNICIQAEGLAHILEQLIRLADEHKDVILPGYTHLQVAQPIRLGHYFLAYFWKFSRDLNRLFDAFQAADRLPLGAGAFAGVNYNTDRALSARLLDFQTIAENSMDAVSERDYQLDYLYFASVLFTHISRLAEEFVIYSSVEFGFFRPSDAVSTGSSIMPQKKNPDLAELLRGKSARILGALNRAFILVKAQPLTYNRDLQEDKENLFDTVEQTTLGLEGVAALLANFEVRPENMRRSLDTGYATATDLADALVSEKGVGFRDAHEIVGKLVGALTAAGQTFDEASSEMRASVHQSLADDEFFKRATDTAASADKKISRGGTAASALVEQRKAVDAELARLKSLAFRPPPTIEDVLNAPIK